MRNVYKKMYLCYDEIDYGVVVVDVIIVLEVVFVYIMYIW